MITQKKFLSLLAAIFASMALPAFADQSPVEQAATEAEFRAIDTSDPRIFEVIFDVYG